MSPSKPCRVWLLSDEVGTDCLEIRDEHVKNTTDYVPADPLRINPLHINHSLGDFLSDDPPLQRSVVKISAGIVYFLNQATAKTTHLGTSSESFLPSVSAWYMMVARSFHMRRICLADRSLPIHAGATGLSLLSLAQRSLILCKLYKCILFEDIPRYFVLISIHGSIYPAL